MNLAFVALDFGAEFTPFAKATPTPPTPQRGGGGPKGGILERTRWRIIVTKLDPDMVLADSFPISKRYAGAMSSRSASSSSNMALL